MSRKVISPSLFTLNQAFGSLQCMTPWWSQCVTIGLGLRRFLRLRLLSVLLIFFDNFKSVGVHLCFIIESQHIDQHICWLPKLAASIMIIAILVLTLLSCQEAWCVCRQAAVQGYRDPTPLVDPPDPSKTLFIVSAVLKISHHPGP